MSNQIDTRDLVNELEDLENEREALTEDVADKHEAWKDAEHEGNVTDDADRIGSLYEEYREAQGELSEWDIENEDRLAELRDLIEEIGEVEARAGIALIPEDEFEDYARQFAEDIGAIEDDARWPATCIDWEQAANELRMDYSSITFGSDDYLYRV